MSPRARPTKKRRRNKPGNVADDGTRGRLRRCIVSRAASPKETLLRFAVDEGGVVVADVCGRGGGRGLWLSPGRDMVNTACARNLFARAARKPVKVAPDLGDQVERLLVRRCLELVGLAGRGGRVATGRDAASEWLRAGGAGVLLVAADGPEEDCAGLRSLASDVPVLDLFDEVELSRALGRHRAVHVVVAPGRLADRLIREGVRLARFRHADAIPEHPSGSAPGKIRR
jgi:uncharacterized protein